MLLLYHHTRHIVSSCITEITGHIKMKLFYLLSNIKIPKFGKFYRFKYGHQELKINMVAKAEFNVLFQAVSQKPLDILNET